LKSPPTTSGRTSGSRGVSDWKRCFRLSRFACLADSTKYHHRALVVRFEASDEPCVARGVPGDEA
jgi:hypothetical protein